MSDTLPRFRTVSGAMPSPVADVVDRLRAHRLLSEVPRAELEWLAAHGTLERYQPGHIVSKKAEPIEGMYIIFSGRLSHHNDQSGTWRKVIEWRGGDITGMLPYSRLGLAFGNTVVDEELEGLRVPSKDVALLPMECPHLTAALVHVMVDRARAFRTSDLQVEKMASLGKLAAGLAHELNNPASAAARSAQLLSDALKESDDASRALGATQLSERDAALIDRVRTACGGPSTKVLTPIERADREESIADWLRAHGVDEELSAPLADTDLSLKQLDELAGALSGDRLHASIRWVAAGCTVNALSRDIERAAMRVHDLVSAVKGFTYMDHASVPEPVDVVKGLMDTIAVLGNKARGKGVSLTVDAPKDLPRVSAVGGELNQVWANLVDNALDAVADGGKGTVSVSARAEGRNVVVRVVDNGPGIAPEVRAKMFDPFFTTKPIGKGTGLGLDIVQRLVQHNQGQIDVESVPGKTEFRVTLPLA